MQPKAAYYTGHQKATQKPPQQNDGAPRPRLQSDELECKSDNQYAAEADRSPMIYKYSVKYANSNSAQKPQIKHQFNSGGKKKSQPWPQGRLGQNIHPQVINFCGETQDRGLYAGQTTANVKFPGNKNSKICDFIGFDE